MVQYQSLGVDVMNAFKPYEIKPGVIMKNRLVMAPMTTYSGNEDFTVSDEEIDYYRLRSQTLGMVITAATSINDSAQAFERQMSLKHDRFIPSMTKLAKTIKNEGALAVIQLHHGGRMNLPSLHEDSSMIVSASAIKAPRENLVTPKAMTIEDIHQTIEDFAMASKRAIQAGFDGVELHGANTYLLQQFFSPHSNRREDEYGGSVENRMRFIEELIDRVYEVIKESGNKDFILGYRFSPEELEEPGITLEDTIKLVSMLKNKPLDYLHISLKHYRQGPSRKNTSTKPVIDVIQSALNHQIPMIGVGGISTKENIADALENGYEMISIGLAILADPLWGKHVETGEVKREFDAKTMPRHLYDRLWKNREYFTRDGYNFKS